VNDGEGPPAADRAGSGDANVNRRAGENPMIIVRDCFNIDPEGMKEVKVLVREGRETVGKLGYPIKRAMTDLVGEYYTLVMESEFDSVGDFEIAMKKSMDNVEWQKWYGKMRGYITGGHREIFTVLD
jgi:hypothetical protein